MLSLFRAPWMVCALLISTNTIALPSKPIDLTAPDPNSTDSVDRRAKKEDIVESNPFGITFYKQNYVLPYYYTGSPYNKVYVNQIPKGQKLKRTEIKYQLSLKVPVWKKILGTHSNLYFAYTQLSYWQAYNTNAFFRETDMQPELFINNQISIPLAGDWTISTLNVGANHESNGFGNEQERSWNRVYAEVIASADHWMVLFNTLIYMRLSAHCKAVLGMGSGV